MRPSEALAAHREAARLIVASYAVANPRVFGSTARGEDTEDSDLDILVTRNGNLSYYDIFKLEDDLANLMGIRVDVRTEGEFSDRVMNRIKRDFVSL